MSDMQVALELRAEAGRFIAEMQKASAQFDQSMAGLQGTAQTTGSRVEQALDKVGIRRHSEINAEIRSVEQAYQTLARSGQLSQRELAQASLAMQERIRDLRGETNGWTQSLGKMKVELAAAGAAIFATTRIFRGAATASSEFQTSLAEITTLDFNGPIADMRVEIERLSQEFGGDVVTNARAAYDIISAGASDAAKAVDQLTQSNKLAVGGKTDVATAASGVTSIIGAYGEAAGGAANVTDALFVAMRGGKTTIGELAASVGQVSGLASNAGVSLEEMLAAASALTRTAGSTSQAMTQLQGIMAAVIRPTAEASKMAESLGLEFNTAAIRSQGFAAWMEEVREKTGGNEEVLGRLFGRLEGLNGALQLTGESAGVFADILADMENKAGETDAAVEKMMDTPAQRAARFEQSMAGLQRSLGDAVLALSPLLDGLTALVNKFNDLEPSTRAIIAGIGGLVAATVVLLPALASVARAVEIMHLGYVAARGSTALHTGALRANAGQAALTAGALGILNAAMRALPWVAAIAAAAELTKSILYLRDAKVRLAEAEIASGEASERLRLRLLDLARDTGLVLATMEEFNQAVEDGTIVYDEASGQWQAAAQTQRELADAAEDATEALDAQADPLRDQMAALLNSSQAAGRLVVALREIDPAAEDAADAVDALIGELDLADRQDLNALRLALEDVAIESEETAAIVRDRLLEAIREADGATLRGLLAEVEAIRDAGGDAADELKALAGEALAESFRRLGLTIDQEMGRIGPASQRAIDALDGVLTGIGSLGMEAEQQSATISRAFAAAFDSADTAAAIAELENRLQSAGQAGLLTADAYETLREKLAELRGEAEQSAPPIENVARAHERATRSAQTYADAVDSTVEPTQQARKANLDHAHSLRQAGLSAEDAATGVDFYAQTLARIRRETEGSVRGMATYTHWWNHSAKIAAQATEQFVRLERSLQDLDNTTRGASSRTQALEMRLLELNGTEEEIAQARAAREREQIELEMQRNLILAERARLAGDASGAEQFRLENEELTKQLDLLRQIENTERQQRADNARPRSDDEPATSRGSDKTVTIQLEGGGRSVDVPAELEFDILALIEEAIRRSG